MKWDLELEEKLLELKERGYTNEEIASFLETTVSSVKHKYTRLKQQNNANTHHHPVEKQNQIEKILGEMQGDIYVLETHAGYGNLTKIYSLHAKEVESYETNKNKCEYINQLGHDNVVCHERNSLSEMYLSIYQKLKYNVIDIDPYGFPSRYFPDIFELIDDGFVFVTLPKYGCTQINNITRLHVKTFYGFDGGKNEEFLECFINTLKNQAMRSYRIFEVVDVLDLKKVYRIAARVKKESAFILCGYEHLAKQPAGNA